ncbi:MAG: aspartate aminotransferase family protein [Spirochaetota bacterium]
MRITDTTSVPKHYATERQLFLRGKGSYLFDNGGAKYLDLGAGIAVNALGYGRRDLARVAARQMRKVVHVSNLYATEAALELGDRLVHSWPGDPERFAACFFGNSGTEANEAAIKFARLYAHEKKGPGNHRLVSFEKAFHGRTLGALAITPTPAYREKFEPLMPGTETLPYNDPEALAAGLDSGVAGVIVEPVQGEGGLEVMTPEFAARLNELCRRHDIILIADEIQTGLGRTGELYGSRVVGLEPDIVSLSKPLAGGLPLSATLIPARVNDLLHPGDHGTTFGGGPVTCAVALKVWETVADTAFLAEVRRKAALLDGLLRETAEANPAVEGLWGIGLLRGIGLRLPEGREKETMKSVIDAAAARGVLILRSGANRIRIAPPLTITDAELRRGIGIVREVLAAWQRVTKQ